MAKEDIPTWVKVATGVVLFAVAIGTTVGGVAWAMGRDRTTHDFVVESLIKTDQRHDQEIANLDREVVSIAKKQHQEELSRTRLEGKIDVSITNQQATTREIAELKTELKKEFTSLAKFLKQFDYDKEKDTD